MKQMMIWQKFCSGIRLYVSGSRNMFPRNPIWSFEVKVQEMCINKYSTMNHEVGIPTAYGQNAQDSFIQVQSKTLVLGSCITDRDDFSTQKCQDIMPQLTEASLQCLLRVTTTINQLNKKHDQYPVTNHVREIYQQVTCTSVI